MSTARFDVFKFYKDGSVLWLGMAEDLEEAQKCAARLPAEDNCKICLRDQHTGNMQTYSNAELQHAKLAK